MPYDQPFAADDGLPDFDPRQAAKDLQLQLKRDPSLLPQAFPDSPPIGRTSLPRGEIRNQVGRPHDPLTPVYEALSPTQQGYGIGQAIGETVKAPTLWEKAQAAFPLLAGMVVPGAPRGKGVPRPVIPREIDNLGFYSQALEAAKAWPQGKGTAEQALQYLKSQQVKDAEIAATGLSSSMSGTPSAMTCSE